MERVCRVDRPMGPAQLVTLLKWIKRGSNNPRLKQSLLPRNAWRPSFWSKKVVDRSATLLSFLCKPYCGVGDNFEGLGLEEDAEGFVAGTEVEDLALAQAPQRTGSKPFAVLPALLENHGIRLGHVEGLAIHLGLRNRKLFGDAAGNGVAGNDGLYLAGLAVGLVIGETAVGASDSYQHAAVFLCFKGYRRGKLGVGLGGLSLEVTDPFDPGLCAQRGLELGQYVLLCPLVHGEHERGGPMRRVQCDEAELAGLYAVDYTLGRLDRDFALADVSPPDEDVTIIEQLVGEALVGVVDADRMDGQAGLLAEVVGDVVAQEVFVHLLPGGLALIPDDNPYSLLPCAAGDCHANHRQNQRKSRNSAHDSSPSATYPGAGDCRNILI